MINNICAVCKNDSAVLIGDTYYCDKCGAEYQKEELKEETMIEFEIVGEPVGKGRPRFSTLNGHAVAFTPQKTATYENLVKISYQQKYAGLVIDAGVPVVAAIDAYFTIPKSASKKARAEMLSGKKRPTKKPDADNIIKSVLDALNGIAYHDDSQVVGVIINKYYSDFPRVVVKLSPTVQFIADNIT